VGNERISSEDLIDCQEGRGEIPIFQVGKGEEMRLSESLKNSVGSSYQQGVLTEEDQRSVLIIGGIRIFLPTSQAEASICVAEATKGQPVVTVMEEKEQISESAPAEKEEHTVKMLTQWEKELEMLEDWLNHPKPERTARMQS
jgi:hypothetical protein